MTSSLKLLSVYFNSLLYKTNVVRTLVTHSAAPRVPLFCSYHILTSSVIYYWTDARQLGIYLRILLQLFFFLHVTFTLEFSLHTFWILIELIKTHTQHRLINKRQWNIQTKNFIILKNEGNVNGDNKSNFLRGGW